MEGVGGGGADTVEPVTAVRVPTWKKASSVVVYS